MEMRAEFDIEEYQDTTPAIPPLAFSLYTTSLSTHCSSCSLPLPHRPHHHSATVNYCSNPKCATTDTPIHHASAEHHLFHLLHSHPSLWPHPDSSDLRLSLRLLLLLLSPALPRPPPRRILGLSTGNPVDFSVIRVGARVIAMATAMRDGRGVEFDESADFEVEVSVLSLVMTNAVEVNVDGEMPVGVAVYDWRFSWINHSCSPNSCFRFVYSTKESEAEAGAAEVEGFESLRIVPFACRGEMVESAACTASELANTGHLNYGPRVIVRTIKALAKGEEVTITYTDLLQPTTLRQSELLLKYHFICNCQRCSAVPQTYVDHALQETICTDLQNNCSISLNNHDKEKAIEMLTDMINCTIEEYMEEGDPVKCCHEIEGLFSDTSTMKFRLSPIHHLSLNVYTTLISTYKIRANLGSGEEQRLSFDLSRISVGYSLLRAGATHHLMLSDRSLVASSATFWMDAGQSLLHLARSSSWRSSSNLPTLDNVKCSRCCLMKFSESNFSLTKTQLGAFDDISKAFLVCMSVITPKVWSYLVQDCRYLKDLKDPIDFSWLTVKKSSDMLDINAQSNNREFYICHGSRKAENWVYPVDEESAREVRSNICRLGVHCLLYGGYLSSNCYGSLHHKTRSIRSVLYS